MLSLQLAFARTLTA